MDADSGPLKRLLDASDYSILGVTLIMSVLIGVYFALFSKRENSTTSDYLTGDKKLKIFPLAMSLAGGYMSSSSFLGMPTEVYMYGSQLLLYFIPIVFAVLAMMYIFMPVIWDLNIISSYEYLRRRFNSTLCMVGSALFLIKMALYLATAIYAPCIALAEISDIKLEYLIPVFSIACIFYTSIGGLKGVVWSEAFQLLLMLAGILGSCIIGTYEVGGFESIWEKNKKSGRIEFFNMDPDPRSRTTFWGITFGFFIAIFSQFSLNQSVVQRCLSLPTFKKSRITLVLFGICLSFLYTANSFNGLIIFTAFYNCDPFTANVVTRQDQVVPYYWMIISENFPALPGILISALYSAAFSTMSTVLNSMAGVFVMDFVIPLKKKPMTELYTTMLMKTMVVAFGCLVIVLSFVIDNLGGVYQSSTTFISVSNGPLLGIFMLGMLFPWANSKGAVFGLLTGFVFTAWMALGAEIDISTGEIKYPTKEFSIDGCDNGTLHNYYKSKTLSSANWTEVFPLYFVSYMDYALFGFLLTFLVGLIASLLTGGNDYKKMDVKLFAPFIRSYVEEKPGNMSTNQPV